MKKVMTFATDVRVNALLCCSAAVLLAACGGGSSDTPDAQVQTAAVTKSSESNQANTAAALNSAADAGASETVAAATASEGSGTVLLATATSVPASTYNLYVATTGSDSNAGSLSAPFRTIQRAANMAKPSTTVHVAAGTYRENISTRTHGTASARIRYVSDTKWGAKIIGSGTEGMWTNNANYTDIVGFDITGSGRLGILNWASYASMTGNYVHNLAVSGGCTGDGGAGIMNANYSGSDDDIIGNVVHDIGVPGACNGVHGIYHANLRGRVMNNIVYRASSYGIHLWHAANNVMVANNTVFRNGGSGMGGGIVTGSGDSPGGVVLNNTKVINNIVYDNPRASIEQFCYSGQSCIGSSNTTANNLVYGNGSGINLRVGSATGTISANPLFVNYQANGSGNYRLQSTSPALDKGVATSAPTYDIDDVARPQGAALDIGAYELIAAPPAPAPTPPPPPPPQPSSIYHLYVATTGSDSNAGSLSAPFRTIQRAANMAKPSTTVHVAAGTYRENISTRTHGTASARIRYVSDTKWGAKIIGSGTEGMWTNNANYTDIVGFDITGSGRLGILNWASYASMTGNYVHNLAVSGGCTGDGGAGIMNANYSGSDDDIIGNVVHDIGVPGACNGVHGIYHANLRGRVMNNIVYRASSYGIHLWHAANNVMVANNTVFRNGGSGMGGGIVTGSGDSPGGVVLNNTKVINNIVYDNPRASIEQFCYSGQSCIGSSNTTANNLVYGNGSGINLRVGSATGTISANPLFVNYQANGSGNYRLQSTSPALDKGVATSAPTYDIDDVARPRGAAHDIGAYESF